MCKACTGACGSAGLSDCCDAGDFRDHHDSHIEHQAKRDDIQGQRGVLEADPVPACPNQRQDREDEP